jgi:hypothetical protein
MKKLFLTILLASAIWSAAEASYMRFNDKTTAQKVLTKIESDMKLPIIDSKTGKVITDKYALIEEIGGKFYLPLHEVQEKSIVFNTATSAIASGESWTLITDKDFWLLKPVVNTQEELAIIAAGN